MSILLASLNFGLYFEVDAHAIYVRSLPLNATTTQLEDEFKKFGTIKPDGIQVRSHKVLVFSPSSGFWKTIYVILSLKVLSIFSNVNADSRVLLWLC